MSRELAGSRVYARSHENAAIFAHGIMKSIVPLTRYPKRRETYQTFACLIGCAIDGSISFLQTHTFPAHSHTITCHELHEDMGAITEKEHHVCWLSSQNDYTHGITNLLRLHSMLNFYYYCTKRVTRHQTLTIYRNQAQRS